MQEPKVLKSSEKKYQMCSKTVMDTTDELISFDKDGISNHYFEYQKEKNKTLLDEPLRSQYLEKKVAQIKKDGIKKKYDCLIGLSGGVDSTYVALLVKKLGLRPLAVHLDNGWNSELAVSNIENIVNKLDIDLHTLVIDWNEFKDIQLSYLKASVIDIEVVSDHAIFSSMYKLAKEHNISHVISGTNVVTEFIMPKSWLYHKLDFLNLKDIHNKYGNVKLKTYPTFNIFKYIYYNSFLKLNPFSILNYVDYQKDEVKKIISDELNWRDYGGKHYESIFTKFYQAYILPEKFGIDKRKAHLSTLICSGQITREDAIKELEQPLYLPNELENDKEYILKKLGLSNSEFETIMNTPPRSHNDFKSDLPLKKKYMEFLKKTEKIRKYFR
ncbi:N-acetyl sugar amidotransferase [Flammeovirga agarivorans]|uniref:N-acetyl sugar amidotransferase n=1 Tax=Flammeovirga agarivorans TaxID=2726742 RepID=A0A7X8SI11_9BACT|nr:N-acetyl sugar amidotransferase [Flammeovirga agarivorans]NLR90507.1 N-acetyl sugar amidotransferase [Flammeovirga agarivorans]